MANNLQSRSLVLAWLLQKPARRSPVLTSVQSGCDSTSLEKLMWFPYPAQELRNGKYGMVRKVFAPASSPEDHLWQGKGKIFLFEMLSPPLCFGMRNSAA